MVQIMHGQPFSYKGQILLLSMAMGHEEKTPIKKLCVCILTRNKYVKSILGTLGSQVTCSFPTLWEWRPSIQPKSDRHFHRFNYYFLDIANKIKLYCR